MSKPQEILELEKVYGITLKETNNEGDIMNWEKSNLYLLNTEQQIIGLNISKNKITEIKNLEKLTNLQKLNISVNQISEIKNLEKLSNLEYLNISYNQISEIKNLEKLTNLSTLNMSDNQISEIKNLEKLSNLEYLNISSNLISEIKNLKMLSQLNYIVIHTNSISKIENLDELSKLSKLSIQSNLISEIENLDKLINLKFLDFYGNQISEIKNLDKLVSLEELDISENKISNLKNLKEILNLKTLTKLQVSSNPFLKETDLVLFYGENHLDSIKSELQKLKETQITIQLPVKVMLLGNHASGKSTFLHYLQTQQCSKIDATKNSSTHVLSVVDSEETINHELPKAIYYDFGGQDYYHGVYQAFFTNESVNLLVWNPKSDSNELLESDSNKLPTRNYNRMYWLAQLQYSFLKRFDTLKNYDDPLLLIQTHADESKAKHNWNEAFAENNVVDEFHISLNASSETTRNTAALQYLTATFWDVVENHSSEKEVPEWYPKFLSYIINKKNTNVISLDTIVDYYKREDLSKTEKRTFLQEDLEQLARKGMLLYYKNDDELNDVAWLNPAATVAKIHDTILNKQSIQKYKGKLPTKIFKNLVKDYPKIERLLLNEKVLFFDKASDEYIIPNYLPLTSEDDEIYDLLKFDFNKPTFVLKFKRFIPFGLINQLICHYGQNPDKKHYWRDQLIFTLNDQFKVWIQLDFSRLTISVSIKSKTAKDSKLNNSIQEIFMGIMLLYWGKDISEIKQKGGFNGAFSNAFQKGKTKLEQYKEILSKTVTPEDLYISTDGEYFVHYNTLDNPEKTKESIVAYPLKENNRDKINPQTQRSYKYRNFTDNENIKQMKKIFISYSRKDVEYKDELRKHLNMLKLFDVADNWSCEDITIGKWHDQIQKELEESDLVIFMLSINFFNSKYILEQEVQKTMDAIANGSGKKVYCIIVSDFPGLDLFNEEDMTEAQKSVLKLSSYQYGMYTKNENRITGNNEEKIISLKEASNRGVIDTQLTKIVTKIMKDIR